MDNLKIAFLKSLGAVCIGCAIFLAFFVCLYLTAKAFEVAIVLGFAALFVDAVLIGTLYHYETEEKKSSTKG